MVAAILTTKVGSILVHAALIVDTEEGAAVGRRRIDDRSNGGVARRILPRASFRKHRGAFLEANEHFVERHLTAKAFGEPTQHIVSVGHRALNEIPILELATTRRIVRDAEAVARTRMERDDVDQLTS